MGEKYCDEIKCPYNQEETCGFQAANDRTSYSMEEWPKLRGILSIWMQGGGGCQGCGSSYHFEKEVGHD